MIRVMLEVAAGERMRVALQRLVGEGVAVAATDPRVAVLRAVLMNADVVRVPRLEQSATGAFTEAGELISISRFPASDIAWAERQLRVWGLRRGMATPLESIGGGLVVPKFLREEMDRLRRLGVVSSRSLAQGSAVQHLTRHFKEMTTYGKLVPKVRYFAGQAFGMIPTLMLTQGIGGTARVLGTMVEDAPMIAALLKRSSSLQHYFPDFEAQAIALGVPGAGELARRTELLPIRGGASGYMTIDEVHDLIRRFGLEESATRVEMAGDINNLLRQAVRPWWDPRKLTFGNANAWTDIIREWSGVLDQWARASVFVDQMKRGVDPPTAAATAKTSVFDFRTLTEFERNHLRTWITFYAFMRKTTDAHLYALFTDPGRVLAQARFSESTTRAWLSDRETAGLSEDDMSRFILYADPQTTRGGEVHPYYRRIYQSPAVGPGEGLGIGKLVFWLPFVDPGAAGKELLGAANPILQSIFTATTGMNSRLYDVESDRSARVPDALVQTPVFGEWLRSYLQLELRPLDVRNGEDPLLAHEWRGDTPMVWTVPRENRQAWAQMQIWFGTPMSKIDRAGRTFGWVRPKSGDRAAAVATGVTGTNERLVPTEQEVRRRQVEELRRKLENQFDDAKGRTPR